MRKTVFPLLLLLLLILSASMTNFAFAGISKLDLSWSGHVQAGLKTGEEKGNPFKIDDIRGTFGQARLKLGTPLDGTPFLPPKLALSTTLSSDFGGVDFLEGLMTSKFSDSLQLQLGKFKVPTGMDWHVSYADLELIERSDLTRMLDHGREAGFMIAGEFWENLSYNVAYFTSHHIYATRLIFNQEDLHLETSYAKGESAYGTVGIGVGYDTGIWNVKAELLNGRGVFEAVNPTGNNDVITTWYIHLGQHLGDDLELVLRHYNSTQKIEYSATEYGQADLTNTYLGANITLEKNLFLKFNYIAVGGNGRHSTSNIRFREGGYLSDTFLALFRMTF